MAQQSRYRWAASPHDSQTVQLQACPNLKWNLCSLLCKVQLRSLALIFTGSLHHSQLAESLQFSPCTQSLRFVRTVSGLLLISSDFLSLGCALAGFLFGIFPLFFCCYYEINLWSLGFFPYSFKHIFVILIIKKFFLDHQLLPNREPISSLCIFGCAPRGWNSTCLFCKHIQLQHLSHLGSWASHSPQIAFRDALENIWLLKSNNYSSTLILFNLASDLGIQWVIETLYPRRSPSFSFLSEGLWYGAPSLDFIKLAPHVAFFPTLGSVKFSLEIQILLVSKPITCVVQPVPELLITFLTRIKVNFMVADS